MNLIAKVRKAIDSPAALVFHLSRKGFFRWMKDSTHLKMLFYSVFAKKLNLEHPRTYNEKLQWLKLHNHNPLYTTLVDKYEVKDYVATRIGVEYIIPTLKVWHDVDEIDIDTLPNSFVIKATHDSGSYSICKDKSVYDFGSIKRMLKKALKHNYYYDTREWPYKDVQPRIIAEEFIGFFPDDYKFFVFNGEIDSVMVCCGREKGHPDFYFYDTDWNRLYYQHDEIEPNDELKRPKNFDTMISIVRELGKDIPHVRIDLYNIEGKIYFGEFTFYDQSGFDTDITSQTDVMWGSKIDIESLSNLSIDNL